LTFEAGKERLMELLGSFATEADRQQFAEWLKDDVTPCLATCQSGASSAVIAEGRQKLSALSQFLRGLLAQDETGFHEAVFGSEQLHFPEKFAADSSEMNPSNTLHVDGFLFDAEDEEEMVERGILPTAVCRQCGSRNTQNLNYITHSCSKEALEYIFTSLLPPLPKESVVLDIGSRLGAVLYGAFAFTECTNLVGIEMNEELCRLQSQTVQRFGMQDRIRIECAEMTTVRPEVFTAANVVVLNNVFEFFVGNDDVKASMWNFLRKALKPATLVVAIPAIEKSIASLNTEIQLNEWLEELPPFRPKGKVDLKVEDESAEIHLYRVRQ